MAVTITWHGHSALALGVDGSRVLVDPFFTDNPVAITSADEMAADFVLVTHGHGDHVGDALEIAKRSGALVIANFEICNWFTQNGHENVHAQHIGGGYSHPFGHVKLTIAFHGSAMPDGSYGGMACGFLLTVGGKRIYIAGDTALYSDMQLIGRDGLDLAILPIGDNFTMDPVDALHAVKFLGSEVVVPYHYDTWPPIVQDVDAWAARVREETSSRVVVLQVGESIDL